MYTIGICDDEKLIREQLQRLVLSEMSCLQESAEIILLESGKAVLCFAEKLDMLFLDIEMPEMDGIRIGNIIHRQNPYCKVIMATCMEHRYKEAFQIGAFRFVTKPFRSEEIREALQAVIREHAGMRKLKVFKNRNSYELWQKDVLYIRALDSYVEIYCHGGCFRNQRSLSELEKELDSRMFFRINRQDIVNIAWVTDYSHGIMLIDKTEMKVSVRRRKGFEGKYIEYDVLHR